jgi:choline dehydrogenase
MAVFDYVILGAGAAGCVLANRLSENPHNEVLLIEAGGHPRNPYFHVPALGATLFGQDKYSWSYHVKPFGPNQIPEVWPRGKAIGGSTAINGMIYNRGYREDYDTIERLGNRGWGWDDILPFFKAIEDNQYGPSPTRGSGGPVHITAPRDPDPLCDDVIKAGIAMGWHGVEDFNESDDERIGPAMATIHKGVRVSASSAFLNPVRKRGNLHVATQTYALRLIFENGRAVGVVTRTNGTVSEVRARRDVIVAMGALNSPQLLQLSGIGPREVLKDAGVPVYLERENVGRRMLEHFVVVNSYRLKEDIGYNRVMRSGPAKAKTALKYLATRKGALATAGGDVMAIFKTRPDVDRVDGQVLVRLLSTDSHRGGQAGGGIEALPGLTCAGEVLRPTSEGSVWITSSDPDAALMVDPNYLATEYDRKTSVDLLRKIRQLFEQSPLADRISYETGPGPEHRSDADLLEAILDTGATGYHGMGTCAMGPGDEDIVDDHLRVRGVEGLRIMDCSVLPTMVSGNHCGPLMAMAARAAELILDDARSAQRIRPGA